MLFLLACAALSPSYAKNVIQEVDVAIEFAQWVVTHGKMYDTPEELADRLEIYRTNRMLVNAHNVKPNVSYTLKLNQFADLTWSEFKAGHLGAMQNCSATHRRSFPFGGPGPVILPLKQGIRGPGLQVPVSKGHHIRGSGPQITSDRVDDQPSSVDWRKKGVVTPVKDQGHCGSCWTFSTTGCLESHHAIKTGKLVTLSEQNLIDCAQAFGNMGCNGGLPSQAFEYVRYNGGLDTEEAYPYEGKDDQCRFSNATVGATVTSQVNITFQDEGELQKAVANAGPVSIAFQVASDFRFYDKGVYDSSVCKSGEKDVNHAVLAVGFNTDENGKDYWIVKNSWGTTWGIDGYFNIVRGKNMCGLADCASYPIV